MTTTRLTFHGAAGGVTGSCCRPETGAGQILIDCGLFQGSTTKKKLIYRPFPIDPAGVAAVILSHGHIDHSELLPKLVRHGFVGAKAPTLAKVINDINEHLGPEDAVRHVPRKRLNSCIESDNAALKRVLRPMRGLRDLSSTKAKLEAFRAIRKADLNGATKGVAQEIAFIADLFQDGA